MADSDEVAEHIDKSRSNTKVLLLSEITGEQKKH